MYSHWKFWIGNLSPRFSVSSMCDLTLAIPQHCFPSWCKQTLVFFLQMCLLWSTVAYLCLNMINPNEVDISECHSEKVTSFFRCSVYMYTVVWLLSPSTHWSLIFFVNPFMSIVHSSHSTVCLFALSRHLIQYKELNEWGLLNPV